MRLPYEKFLRWQLLLGETDEQIESRLEDLTMAKPSAELLAQLREKTDAIPLPGSTRRRLAKKLYDKTDEMYAEKLGFRLLYLRRCAPQLLPEYQQDPWLGVDQILRNPVLRIAVECGSLVELSISDLSAMITPSFSVSISEEALQIFLDLYFATAAMSKKDWAGYLELHAGNPYVYHRYYAALTKPRDQVLYMVGLPTKKAFSDFLKNVLTTADFKFRYYVSNASPEHDEQARKWAKIGFDAGTRHEKFSAGDVTDFSKTVQTAFEYDSGDIPALPPDMLSQVKPPEEKEQKKTDIPAPAPEPIGDPNHL